MYRSRFSNASPAGAAGGVAHGKLSDFAETAIPPSPRHLRKAVVQKVKEFSQKGSTPKRNKRLKRMDLQGALDGSILFADLAKIRKMASEFRELETQNPQRYFPLPVCDTFESVKNGGPPFQVDNSIFAEWA